MTVDKLVLAFYCMSLRMSADRSSEKDKELINQASVFLKKLKDILQAHK